MAPGAVDGPALPGALTCALRLLLCASWTCLASARHLQRLVVVSRHSVVNAYPAEGEALVPGVAEEPLSSYAQRALPPFPGLPGQLTPKGRLLMRRLGAFYRERYAGLLARAGCGRVSVVADPGAQQRATDSATAFAEELLGGALRCTARPVNAGLERPQLCALFRGAAGAEVARAGSASDCGPLALPALAALLGLEPGRAATPPAPWLAVYRRQLGLVQERTSCCAQRACGPSGPGLCSIFGLPASLVPNSTRCAVGGPLGVGAALAEIFAMQYCEGLEAGWGLSGEDVAELLSLLEVPFHEAGANEVSARNLGSDLLASVLQALAAAQDAPDPSVVLYFGHATNLQYLRRMLRLTWLSEGWWPNVAEPGGQLVFEVYDEEVGRAEERFTVRVLKVAATPEQQRRGLPLNSSAPPSVVPLWVPGCDGPFCPLAHLLSIGRAALRPSCLEPTLAGTLAVDSAASLPRSGAGAAAAVAAEASGAGGSAFAPSPAPAPPPPRAAAEAAAPAGQPAVAPATSAPQAEPRPGAPPGGPAAPQGAQEPAPEEAATQWGTGGGGGTPLLLVLAAGGAVGCLYYRRARASARGYEALGGRRLGAPGIEL